MHEALSLLAVCGGVGVSGALPDDHVMEVRAGVLSVLDVKLERKI